MEPANVEAAATPVNPAPVEATQTQPTPMEPAKVESPNVQPAKVEAVNGEPAKSEMEEEPEFQIKPNQGETDRIRLQEMEKEIEALNKTESEGAEVPKTSSKPIAQEVKTEYEENAKLREMVANLRETLREKNLTLTRKNLQTEALEIQISALKEVTVLSKGMLDIRNVENVQLKEQIDSMQDKITAERERHNLVLKKAERAATINSELQNEYHKQANCNVNNALSIRVTSLTSESDYKVALFGELKESYEKKLNSLKAEIKKLEELQNTTPT